MVRVDSVQAQRVKTKRDYGASSLCGVSLAPERHTDPVTESRVAMRTRNVKSHGAAKFAPGRDRNSKRHGTPLTEIFVCLGKEVLGIEFCVRMRNVQSRSSDFVCSGETYHGADIFALKGAKQQAGGPQFLRSCHEASLRETNSYVRRSVERGDAVARKPGV